MLSGMPYPIVKYPLGLLYSQKDIDQVKSDLLVLLLTNPGERIMLPSFGTALRSLIFEPNDSVIAAQAKAMIINSIATWEPRIAVRSITTNSNLLNTDEDDQHVLSIKIEFVSFGQINEIQTLKLAVPLSA